MISNASTISTPTVSFLNIPADFFEPGKLYRWRVAALREYFDENIDNMSLAPGSTWAMPVFAITATIDADGDGMPDYWEELHGLDPTVNDAGIDLDGDGLTNGEEFQKTTDPQDSDTDDDTYLDGADTFPHFASEWADSDGDGTGDNSDNCPVTSNADQADWDTDGVGDACDPPNPPSGISFDGSTLSWDASADPNIITYRIHGGNTSQSYDFHFDAGGPYTQFTITNLEEGRTYYFTVTAVAQVGTNVLESDYPPEIGPIVLYADGDGDGIPDDLDNCLNLFNAKTNWVDINGDTHVDAQADFDLDEIGDPCDPDDDNDGVVDAEDNCPFAFNQKVNGLQPDLDGDGIGNACDQDADGDGYVFFIYYDPAVNLNGYDCDDSDPDPAYINGNCLGSAAPKKKDTIQDRDGDGITDDQDSCPDNPNIGDKDGDGIDGACDGCDIAGADPDRDNICTANDNCPDVYNPAQLASDCPPPVVDADGDGFSPPEDCNDDDQKIYPGAPEIIDGVDNDCNNTIDDTNAYFVHFEMQGYDDWLPEDGNTATVTVSVQSATPNGPTVTPNPPGFTATTVPGSESAMPGKYTNDPSGLSGADITYTLAGNQLEFTSHDYGGRITVRVEAKVTVAGIVYPVFGEFTLPKDADKDGLPDKWEMDMTRQSFCFDFGRRGSGRRWAEQR